MRRYVARNSAGGVYQVMGTLDARLTYEIAKERIDEVLFWLPWVFIFSPVFFIVFATFSVYRYWREIKVVFFPHKEVTAKYKSLFTPLTNKSLFSAIGYRVYPEELEDHLALVNSDEKEDMKKLAKKGARMRRDMSRQFGFNVDKITRHAVFLGTTGAGKTETVMSFFIDIVKAGAGIGMVDGKSDQAMEYKIYNLCKEYYFETQFYAIILNKPELGTESNTYSPLLSYNSAMKASEFLGAFISGDGGGNADYFANRGKVMLGNIVMHYKNRQKYYKESFSIGDLSSAINQNEMNNIYYLSYGVALDIESLIKDKMRNDKSFSRLIDRAKEVKTAQSDLLENSEVLTEYINQNSHLVREVEKVLGLKFDFISNYYSLFTLLDEYISGISSSWRKYVFAIADGIYLSFKSKNRGYIYTSPLPVRMKEIRSLYAILKNENSDETKEIFKMFIRDNKKVAQDEFSEAMGYSGGAENAEKINQDAMQQHNYAVQQWSRLFGLFQEYSRITGTPFPEVDGEDIIKNNKVLYVMLPVMELSEDQVSMLGRMFILMFKNISSIALGGDKQSATPIQFKIYQNKIKPNPVFLMVLDELGAYMTSGVSILLSQLRSLRIAMLLSIQETVSVQPNGGEGQREQARIMGNLAKLVLQNRDGDTHEFEKMIPEVEVIESDSFLHSAVGNRVYGSKSLTVKKVKNFEIGQSSRFAKGFGVYVDGARDEPTYFQSYYIGDNGENPLQIRKFDAFENIYNT